jgi:hypothetical protein
MPQAQDGYGQGLQFGLSLFNSLQNASYLQGLEADRQERIEIQRQDAARRQQEFQYQQQQNELTRAQFLMQHPEAAPPEARVAAFNTIGQYVSGKDHRPITQLTLEGWDKENNEIIPTLEATPDMQSFTNKLTEYEARAAEHPLRMEAFNRMKPALERIGKERGVVSTIKTLTQDLFSEDEINKMVKNSNPDTLTKMWEDKDTSKMLANQQIDKVMTAWHSGEPVSSDKLRSALAMARAVGRELGPKAEDLLKTHDTYTMYNESEEQLKTHQQKLDPLFKQIRANQKLLQPIKDFEPLKTSADDFAGVYGKNPFSLIEYGGKADTARRQAALHDDFMTKQPQFAEELGKQAREASWRDADLQAELQRVQQDIAQAGADPMNPNRNMTIHLLERKVDQIKRERDAIAPLVKYDGQKDIVTLKGVLNMENRLNKQTLEVRGLRQTALSESDRRANAELQQKQVDVNQKKATAEGEMLLNRYLSQNPNATEAEIRGQTSKIAENLKGTYKVAPDSNKILDNVLAKKQSIQDDTLPKLTPEQAEKVMNSQSGMDAVGLIEKNLFDKGGHLKYDELAKSTTNLPWTSGRTLTAYIKQALDPIVRARTGAAIKDEEMPFYEQQFIPSVKDSEETAKAKLQRLKEYFGGTLDLVDPQGKLRARIKKQPAVAAPTAPAMPEGKSFEAYQKWKRANPNGSPAEFFGD